MKLFAFLAVTVFADYDGHADAIDQATLLTNQNQANVDNAGAAHAAGSCFTCSAFGANTADTYANCHSSGSVMACPTENSVEEREKLCSLDVTRAANGEVIGITTGCKDRVACIDDSRQNFVGGRLMMSQCKPNPSLFSRSRFASKAPSTCRTCILACDGDGTGCFRANDENNDDSKPDGVFQGSAYIGAPGDNAAFDQYPIWYPGKLLANQVAAQP